MSMRVLAAAAVLCAFAAPAASAKTMLNVIPHGQRAPGAPWVTDQTLPADTQARMYDRLTPLFRNVTDAELVPSADGSGYFKSAELLDENDPSFVSSETVQGTSPSAGAVSARIKRDAYGVPHIYSDTDAGAIFGAGYVVAEDQSLLLTTARGAGIAALVDMPGVSAIDLVRGLYTYDPPPKLVAQAAALQTRNIRRQGAHGKQLLEDLDTYLAGINARFAQASPTTPAFTRADIYGINGIKSQYLGQGGGKETANALFLDGLRSKFGAKRGDGIFTDLQARNDPETAVTTDEPVKAQVKVSTAAPRGMVRLVNGTFKDSYVKLPGATTTRAAGDPDGPRATASNILMVAGAKSATGFPLFAGGPQIKYNYPGLTLEMQIRSPSINVRGATAAAFPGYMLIGSGPDYAWTLTSPETDVIDTYAETLCGGSKVRYRYKGRCRRMKKVDGGTIAKGGQTTTATWRTTVHGPVIGYARNRATRKLVALSRRRSSYGKDAVDLLFNQQLTFGRVHSLKDFVEATKLTPQTFNSFYANKTEIGFYTAGYLPKRPRGVNPTLPVSGTGRYEWRGLLPASGHSKALNPASGLIVNWNNKPARNNPASDSRFGEEGGPQRDQLLLDELGRFPGKLTLANVLAAENAAATEDVRGALLWPTIRAMLAKAPAPDALSSQMADVLDHWSAAGASRVDADLDGKIDDPGALIMDTAWDRIADAGLCDRLGSALCEQLNGLQKRFDAPPDENQYAGWQHYLYKDLRSILGQSVKGRYSTTYCGKGDATACATELWAALASAGQALAAQQGPDPTQWRKPTDYIEFSPVPLFKLQYTNRPTGIHQVMTFGP